MSARERANAALAAAMAALDGPDPLNGPDLDAGLVVSVPSAATATSMTSTTSANGQDTPGDTLVGTPGDVNMGGSASVSLATDAAADMDSILPTPQLSER